MGLGERLATLEALSDRPHTGVAALLVRDIERCRWRVGRLAIGRWELVGLAVGVAVLGSLWLPVGSGHSTPLDVPRTAEAHQALVEDEDDPPQHAQSPAAQPRPDAGKSGYTPYVDLLASVLGIDAVGELWDDPEALGTALAQQQGLLRELAERMAELAAGEREPGRTDGLSELATELAREDLRDIVLRAVRSGERERAAEARDALDAVLSASEDAAQPGDAPAPAEEEGDRADKEPVTGVPAEGETATTGEAAESEAGDQGDGHAFSELMGEFPEMNGMLGAPATLEGGPEAAESPPSQPGGTPGAARGESVQESSGRPVDEPQEDALTPVAVRPDDGLWRAYVVIDAPGEAPGEAGEPVDLSPQEIDLLLRVRAVPPELRDIVRRYFEHVTMGVGGEP